MLDFGYYNIDCIEGMRLLSDESIDLIITSPPYNLGEVHHTGSNRFKSYNTYLDNMPEQEYQLWQIQVLNECYRVLKNNGSIMYNHKNRIKGGVQISPYEWLYKTNFIIKQEVVWFNGSQNFDKVRFYPMTERVYWLTKNADTKLVNIVNHHDIFEWAAEGTDKKHKRSFPAKMVRDLLLCFPNAKVVLDIFSGSGTTGIVCHELDRDFIGFEIDKEYYEESLKRLDVYKSQVSLLDITKADNEQIVIGE